MSVKKSRSQKNDEKQKQDSAKRVHTITMNKCRNHTYAENLKWSHSCRHLLPVTALLQDLKSAPSVPRSENSGTNHTPIMAPGTNWANWNLFPPDTTCTSLVSSQRETRARSDCDSNITNTFWSGTCCTFCTHSRNAAAGVSGIKGSQLPASGFTL